MFLAHIIAVSSQGLLLFLVFGFSLENRGLYSRVLCCRTPRPRANNANTNVTSCLCCVCFNSDRSHDNSRDNNNNTTTRRRENISLPDNPSNNPSRDVTYASSVSDLMTEPLISNPNNRDSPNNPEEGMIRGVVIPNNRESRFIGARPEPSLDP